MAVKPGTVAPLRTRRGATALNLLPNGLIAVIVNSMEDDGR